MNVSRFWAGSTVVVLVALGGGVGLAGACSPTSDTSDAGDGGPVCDPDSGDPAGCACDPTKTQTADCYTGPPGTNSKGICKAGKRSCTPQGTFTVCEGEVTPQTEICNYADDDCNGIIDDLPEITDAAVIAHCTSPACDPDFSDAAITCWGPDPGICGAGRKTCTGTPKGGQPTGCEEFIHTPAAEVCNGIDDDCNGIVDDGLDNLGACDVKYGTKWPADASPFDGSPSIVLGECLHGQLACAGNPDGGTVCQPSQPGTEVQQYGAGCDGLDNDCNGKIDDHACSDTFDTQNGYTYCCNDGYGYFSCVSPSQVDAGYYTSCTLAN